MICQGIGFYLCLLYLPDDSTTSRIGTFSPTWAEPSTASILATAFFLGLGSVLYKVITRRSSPPVAGPSARPGTNSKYFKTLHNRRLNVSKPNRLLDRIDFPRGGERFRFFCPLSGDNNSYLRKWNNSFIQFIQALAAAAAFFYSVYVGLMYQLLILVIFMIVGTSCFLYLEIKYAKKFPVGEESWLFYCWFEAFYTTSSIYWTYKTWLLAQKWIK